MNGKQKNYWWIDVVLFAGFLVAFFLSLTGVELHQWIGILGGILALYHLIIHWDWITVVNRRFFDGATRVVKAKFIVDSLLLIGFFLIVGTGLVISTWLDLGISNYAGWLRVHILVSILSLCVLLVKMGLHWKWIARSTYSTLSQQRNIGDRHARPQSIPVRAEGMDRRNFLRVMGVVGGA